MKKPTLEQLIESAETEVNSNEWFRRELLRKSFIGMSQSAFDNYQREMESIPEFNEGILKPGHSSTFINYNIFVWFLKWKQVNKHRVAQISPDDVLRGT